MEFSKQWFKTTTSAFNWLCQVWINQLYKQKFETNSYNSLCFNQL